MTSPLDASASNSRQNRLIIVLADISGYTDLMVASQTAAMHGQMIVTILIESILKEVEIPLRLQEIEGDAVFLYAEHPGNEEEWREVCAQVGGKLTRFFTVFAEAIVETEESTLCRCAICKTSEMRLKVVVHSGEAVFHKIDRFAQVSGVDVIKAHRLLKNSVPSHEYILLTDGAHRDLGPLLDLDFAEGQESYEGLGAIPTFVHFPGEQEAAVRRFYAQSASQVARRGVHYAGWVIREEIKTLFAQVRHPVAPGGRLRRAAYGTLMGLASPLVFLVLAMVTPVRLLLRRAQQG